MANQEVSYIKVEGVTTELIDAGTIRYTINWKVDTTNEDNKLPVDIGATTGRIAAVITRPGTTVPAENYGIKLVDRMGDDVLASACDDDSSPVLKTGTLRWPVPGPIGSPTGSSKLAPPHINGTYFVEVYNDSLSLLLNNDKGELILYVSV